MRYSGGMADFGGGFVPPPGPDLEMLARAQLDEARTRRADRRHRPPKRPRFGLLRRIVRAIRGGGD